MMVRPPSAPVPLGHINSYVQPGYRRVECTHPDMRKGEIAEDNCLRFRFVLHSLGGFVEDARSALGIVKEEVAGACQAPGL